MEKKVRQIDPRIERKLITAWILWVSATLVKLEVDLAGLKKDKCTIGAAPAAYPTLLTPAQPPRLAYPLFDFVNAFGANKQDERK